MGYTLVYNHIAPYPRAIGNPDTGGDYSTLEEATEAAVGVCTWVLLGVGLPEKEGGIHGSNYWSGLSKEVALAFLQNPALNKGPP